MPWKTSSVMEEKLRFIFEHELRERSMTELCERYEITRQTGYMWLRRHREAGAARLLEQSRAAHRHHNQMPEEIEQRCWSCGRHTCAGGRESSSAFWSGTSRGETGRRPAPSERCCSAKAWWCRARSARAPLRTANRWRMRMDATRDVA